MGQVEFTTHYHCSVDKCKKYIGLCMVSERRRYPLERMACFGISGSSRGLEEGPSAGDNSSI